MLNSRNFRSAYFQTCTSALRSCTLRTWDSILDQSMALPAATLYLPLHNSRIGMDWSTRTMSMTTQLRNYEKRWRARGRAGYCNVTTSNLSLLSRGGIGRSLRSVPGSRLRAELANKLGHQLILRRLL